MGDRVRLKRDKGGQWWLGFTHYAKLYWQQTGTTDEAEARAMAAEVEVELEKARSRPDWRPDGLDPTPPAPAPRDEAAFNAPRIVR